jgi:hypothetical protein
MYHGAIMSIDELALLRTIGDVIRLGRVETIDAGSITLAKGKIGTYPDTLYVNCSASGVTRRPLVPVFADDTITMQMVKPIQPVFSAALVARVETLALTEPEKNALCPPALVPDTPADWLNVLLAGLGAQGRWASNSDVKAWIASTRLDTFGMMARAVKPDNVDRLGLLKRVSSNAMPAAINAKRLLGSETAASAAAEQSAVS